MVQAIAGRPRWQSIVAVAALAIATLGALTNHVTARANTYGNTDQFEQSNQIASPWWGGASRGVNQRYGCTDLGPPEDPAPGYCPYPFSAGWHQGIDIAFASGLTVSSAVHGYVRDFQESCLDSWCTLGYLSIGTDGGNVVYLLHGTPAYPFPGTTGHVYQGAQVNIGDPIYTTGGNGLTCPPPCGPHLHFEVHRSMTGPASFYTNPGPGDDINPEGWLFRIPATYGKQLTSWSAGRLGEFVQPGGAVSALYQSNGTPTGGWDSSWTFRGQPYTPGSGFHPLRTDPVAVSQSPDEGDVFAILQDGNLGWWSWAYGVVCDWQFIAHPTSQLNLGLTAVSPYPGRLDVFAQGTDLKIYHWSASNRGTPACNYLTTGWQSGFPAGSNFGDDLAAVASDSNNIYVVARNGTALWMIHGDGVTWSPWDSRGGGRLVFGGLSAVAWSASSTTGTLFTELHVFVLGADYYGNQQLYDQTYSSATDGWSGWQSNVSAAGYFAPTTDFVAVSWTAFRIDLFVRDQTYDANDGWLWHTAYSANSLGSAGWTGYYGQNFHAPPSRMVSGHVAAVALGYQNIDIVAQTNDRVTYNYWHLCYCNNTWNTLPSGP